MHILVTGASSGIGKAICERLLAEGHRVTGFARDFSKFPCTSDNFLPLAVDLSDLDHLPSKLEKLREQLATITSLVCCAGRGEFAGLEELSYGQIKSLIDLNFTSQAFLVKHFLPLLKRSGDGNIIFIGSEAAISGSRKGTIYCASKFALRGFAQALRDESAKSGVRVSIINPGMVKTTFFDKLNFRHGSAEENYILPEDVAETVAMILRTRTGTVFDEINLSPLTKVIDFDKKK